ncbi:MAG: hypothetical protein QM760_22025 [Nibricoccus sp.]
MKSYIKITIAIFISAITSSFILYGQNAAPRNNNSGSENKFPESKYYIKKDFNKQVPKPTLFKDDHGMVPQGTGGEVESLRQLVAELRNALNALREENKQLRVELANCKGSNSFKLAPNKTH